MKINDHFDEYQCRFFDFIRCVNPIIRENLGDLFDYPFCEECQKKEDGLITRFDNGEFKVKATDKMKKCDRCKEDYEKIYCIPYVHDQFAEVHICRQCSMEFHKEIKKFAKEFISNELNRMNNGNNNDSNASNVDKV